MPGYEIRLAELEGGAGAPMHQKGLWAYVNQRLPVAHKALKSLPGYHRTSAVDNAAAPELSTFHLYRLLIEFLLRDAGRAQKLGVSPLTARLQGFADHELRFEMGGAAQASLGSLEDFFNQINENIFGAGFLRFQVRKQTAEGTPPGDVLMNVEPCPLLAYEARTSGVSASINRNPYSTAPKWEYFVDGQTIVLGYFFDPSSAFLALDHDRPEWIRFFEAAGDVGEFTLRGAGWNQIDHIRQTLVHPNGPARENLLYQALYLIEGQSIRSHLIQFEPTGMGFGGGGRADRVNEDEFHYRVLRVAEGRKPENPWLAILEDKLPKNEWVEFRNPSDFAQCNTPGGVASEHGNPRWLPFEVHYFRREMSTTEGQTRIEKSCTKTPLRSPDISPHLPIRAVHNAQKQDLEEGSGAAISPQGAMEIEGAYLGRSRGPRADAKGVMKPVAGDLSATQFLDAVLEKSSTARTMLGRLKGVAPLGVSPIKQEWCHLLGHGDGGVEWVGNFVCGSYHCNTEQLAIESAIRHFSHEHPSMFKLHSTAYLLQNDYFSVNWFDAYLPSGNSHSGTRVGKAAPVVALIRYRILAAGPQGITQGRIIFDHLFEGQSEFFDINQYHIVYYSVLASVSRYALDTFGTDEEKAEFQRQTESNNLITLINRVLREGPGRASGRGAMQVESDSDGGDTPMRGS